MDDYDDADLDGDREFDAIDLEILNGENGDSESPKPHSGCMVVLLGIVSFAFGAWKIIKITLT